MPKKIDAKKPDEKKKAPKEKKLREFTTELPVKLTPEEFIATSKALAQSEIDIRNEEEHAEAVKKDLKTREGLLLVRRSRLAGMVRSGEEQRPVLVEGWARFAEGVYEEIRTDTGEVLEQSRRRLSESERQVPLPFAARPEGGGVTVEVKANGQSLGVSHHETAENLFKPGPNAVDKLAAAVGATRKGRADHVAGDDDGGPDNAA